MRYHASITANQRVIALPDNPGELLDFNLLKLGDGFGICHSYNKQGKGETNIVRDNTIHMLPKGDHTVVSAPRYTTYSRWFLAGNPRLQANVDHPDLGRAGHNAPMFKEMGF